MKKILLFLFLSISFINFSQIQKEKDSLMYVIKKSKNDSLIIEANSALFYKEVYENTAKSLIYYNSILKIAKTKNNLFAFAKAFNLKGIACDVSGKLDSANYYYLKSIVYAKKSKSAAIEGSAYNNLGLINWDQGNDLEALKYFGKSLKIFETIKNEKLVANVYSNIGLIYDDLNDLKKSEYYLKKSLEIRQSIQDQYGLSVSFTNLGKLYYKLKNYKLSETNYKKAIALKRPLNDFMGIATAEANLSTTLNVTYKYDEALKILKEAEEICLKNEAESNILGNVYTGFVDSYIIKKDIKNATIYNNKFLEVTSKINDIARLSNYYEYASDIAILENNYKKAFFAYQKSDSLKKITDGLELKKSISLYETKFQSEKRKKNF
jgi:tetratricopeptide (TPR) repeat protein